MALQGPQGMPDFFHTGPLFYMPLFVLIQILEAMDLAKYLYLYLDISININTDTCADSTSIL